MLEIWTGRWVVVVDGAPREAACWAGRDIVVLAIEKIVDDGEREELVERAEDGKASEVISGVIGSNDALDESGIASLHLKFDE